MLTHIALKEHKDLRNTCKFDHSMCVRLGKFCLQFALFTEKVTQSTKNLHDGRDKYNVCSRKVFRKYLNNKNNKVQKEEKKFHLEVGGTAV